MRSWGSVVRSAKRSLDSWRARRTLHRLLDRRGRRPHRSAWLFHAGPGRGCADAIALLGLGAADGDDVEPGGAGLECSDDLGRDADDIPGPELLGLVVEQDPAGAGDDDVGLLLLLVAVSHRAAQVRGVPKETDPEVAGVQVLTPKAALQPLHPPSDGVLDLEQVDL